MSILGIWPFKDDFYELRTHERGVPQLDSEGALGELGLPLAIICISKDNLVWLWLISETHDLLAIATNKL